MPSRHDKPLGDILEREAGIGSRRNLNAYGFCVCASTGVLIDLSSPEPQVQTTKAIGIRNDYLATVGAAVRKSLLESEDEGCARTLSIDLKTNWSCVDHLIPPDNFEPQAIGYFNNKSSNG
ncbi:predicted protein [Histoplasma capsulatum var. duboisii H88]|uniref:Predicted protein n=1 Tax=Ajellomyces capsulatus (strain H88) TaxID=544711 RepID=F0UGD8_AJEC8|nr:predicted protein [Histoplasma capsulatum var. duboisii H88]